MCLSQGPQRSDAGEAWSRGPSVSSQALYYLATALPSVTILTQQFTTWAPVYRTVARQSGGQTQKTEEY